MSWQYQQSTGKLFYRNAYIATGYAGYGVGKNNPDMQNINDVGPLPCGNYNINAPVDDVVTGKFTLPLDPFLNNVMFGRNEFKIHGDSILSPGNGSHGCIVMEPWVRMQIWKSDDTVLQVIR